jgi:hypothetical protein
MRAQHVPLHSTSAGARAAAAANEAFRLPGHGPVSARRRSREFDGAPSPGQPQHAAAQQPHAGSSGQQGSAQQQQDAQQQQRHGGMGGGGGGMSNRRQSLDNSALEPRLDPLDPCARTPLLQQCCAACSGLLLKPARRWQRHAQGCC